MGFYYLFDRAVALQGHRCFEVILPGCLFPQALTECRSADHRSEMMFRVELELPDLIIHPLFYKGLVAGIAFSLSH